MTDNVTKPDPKRKKQLEFDLILIASITVLVLVLVLGAVGKQFNGFIYDTSRPVLARVAVAAICGQYALAGLGITIVCIMRKEKFTQFGLNTHNLIPALLLSLACCVPDFIYQFVNGNIHTWFPFHSVFTTKDLIAADLPVMIPGFILTAAAWGFFEGFNYVVIRDKLSERYPSKYRFWDVGAFVCAVMCIVIHGVIGVTPDAVMEMLVTMFLIYGMRIVRKETGHAWGCVLIFLVYWNAV
ncbi:MAG: hypothetical protein J6Y57_00085 [Lachnospiraceae bacterium]|nr:hypothetical protein [Lachnospiraceae bacterium]